MSLSLFLPGAIVRSFIPSATDERPGSLRLFRRIYASCRIPAVPQADRFFAPSLASIPEPLVRRPASLHLSPSFSLHIAPRFHFNRPPHNRVTTLLQPSSISSHHGFTPTALPHLIAPHLVLDLASIQFLPLLRRHSIPSFARSASTSLPPCPSFPLLTAAPLHPPVPACMPPNAGCFLPATNLADNSPIA